MSQIYFVKLLGFCTLYYILITYTDHFNRENSSSKYEYLNDPIISELILFNKVDSLFETKLIPLLFLKCKFNVNELPRQ